RRLHSFVVALAVVRAAHGIKFQLPALDSEPVQQRCQHFQYFCIYRGRLAPRRTWPNHLRANLVELAVSAFLRTFASELRANVIETLQAGTFPQLVLNVGAHYSGCIFRAEGQPLSFFALCAPAVLPGKHLLVNNVCLFAHGTLKQLQVFNYGSANFLEVVETEKLVDCGVHEIAVFNLRWQQVAHAAHGFDETCHYFPGSSFRYWAV